jgi:predicted kinase
VLIVFAGPPCSGKSTLAGELARRRGIPHLSMDSTRQRILPGSSHTREDRQTAYRAMHFAAELLLSVGASVILDAPYGHDEDRAELSRLAAGTDFRYIECRVSPETAARWFRARGPDAERPDLTEENVRQSAAGYRYLGTGVDVEKFAGDVEELLLR